jgi:hypothetical protein
MTQSRSGEDIIREALTDGWEQSRITPQAMFLRIFEHLRASRRVRKLDPVSCYVYSRRFLRRWQQSAYHQTKSPRGAVDKLASEISFHAREYFLRILSGRPFADRLLLCLYHDGMTPPQLSALFGAKREEVERRIAELKQVLKLGVRA